MGRVFLFFVGLILAICIFTASPIPAWLIWVVLFSVFFSFLSIKKKTPEQPNFQSQVHKKDEYETLCDLYREAFAHNDFEALQALAKEFACGGAADYWQNNTDAKQKIAQGVKKLAEVVEKYVHTGDKLYIEGQIHTRTWDDRNGIKRSITEIWADSMEMLTPKSQDTPENNV